MNVNVNALTSGRLLARNVILNMIGWLLPALVALVAVPLLVRGLGDARFGVLALAWTAIGYFSLFDLGIGRALTHAVADRVGRGTKDDLGAVVRTAVAIILPIGAAGALALAEASPWLARTVLKVPVELQSETITAFRVMAIAVPFTGLAAALRGVLEAMQRFGVVTVLRVPYGMLTFLGPLLALPFSHSIVVAVAVLTVGRVLLSLAYAVVVARAVPELTSSRWQWVHLRPLLEYGGWMTVSNIISPLMNTFDRFVIGAVLSVSLVTYYAAPHELVTKLWLFTAALWPVYFPAFATVGGRDPLRTAALFDRAMRLTFGGLALPAFLLVLLAHEILAFWLGQTFADRSALTMQVLTIAIFVNCLGQGAYTFIQGLGRPDITGKFHMAELPVYSAMLWFLLPRYGILGAAIAWAVRAIADAALLMGTCPVLLDDTRPVIARNARWLVAAVLACGAAMLIQTPTPRFVVAIISIPTWAFVVWRGVLTEGERRGPIQLITSAWQKATP